MDSMIYGTAMVEEERAMHDALPPVAHPVDVTLPLSVDMVDTAALSTTAIAEWDALCSASGEANVFALPWMLLPAFAFLNASDDASLAIVRDATGRMIGMMPLITAPRLGRIPISTVSDWCHPNSFLSPISIVAGAETMFWQAMIPVLTQLAPSARQFAINAIAKDGAVHRGLLAAAAASNMPIAIERQFQRALLAPTVDAETYWDAAVRPKKRKELRRQWNRLGEEGVITMGRLASGGDVAPWIDEFLALEASGWKGRGGSALASSPATDQFMRAALASAHTTGSLCFTALRLDGRAIAMLITLTSGDAGFGFKTAFDEAFGRFSPGVLLQRESLDILVERNLAWIDSCAAPDHPMIDSLWRERRTIISLSMPLPGRANRILFGAAQVAKAVWAVAKSIAAFSRRTATQLYHGPEGKPS